MRDVLIEYGTYIRRYRIDLPEVRDWRWPDAKSPRCG
jgi:phosphoketolase